MCGIAGFINRDGQPSSAVSVKSMIDIIRHRGPDAQDIYCHENLAYGHVRLSVIDLSPLANQPMHSADGRYTIIYNGEVYNYQQIRAELIKLGHRFESSSDTEVILYAFIEWGAASVERFNGMFAFSILDSLEKEVFFARDRFGIKPLYYGQFDDVFMFASEIKAIEQHPSYRFEINKTGLKEYFSFQNFLSEQTLNDGVSMFPAGNTATLSLKDQRPLSLKQYWDFNFEEPNEKVSIEECREELDRLFQQAVKRQLVSDVPLGSYLSGGIDSGSITAISAPLIEGMHTFTCGFDMSNSSLHEVGFDERDRALEFSRFFETTHHEKVINHRDMENSISKIAWHLDEPRVGQSYPNYYAAELARSQVTVVLSGAGGDELFAGYPWRYYRAVDNTDQCEYLDAYYQYWQRLIPSEAQAKFFSPIWSEIKDFSIKDVFKNVYSDSLKYARSPEEYVNQSLYFEAKTFMHGLLVLEDKLSMAHSLESRVPMLDNDLVAFAMKIPAEFKLASLQKVVDLSREGQSEKVESYFNRSKDGKIILRESMSKYLPNSAAEREKQGFSGPDASWFLKESARYIQDKLLNRDARLYDYVDFDEVSRLLKQHFNGQANARLLIWSLLNVEQWLHDHG